MKSLFTFITAKLFACSLPICADGGQEVFLTVTSVNPGEVSYSIKRMPARALSPSAQVVCF